MKLHESLEEDFNSHAEHLRADVEANIELNRIGLEKCQSVMEQRFANYFIGITAADPVYNHEVEGGFSHWAIQDPERDAFLTLTPQAPVKIGEHQFFADFLLVYKTRRPFAEHFRVVVEIDGHDFHERTKEQAKRDRMRDRMMLMDGFMVFRYTGSEVHNNVGEVCWELYRFLREQQKRFAARVGIDS